MPHLYQTFTGRSMIQDKVGLVCMDSCGSMHTAIEVLRMMGIKAKAVVDLDYAYKGGVRAGLIDDDDTDRQAALLGSGQMRQLRILLCATKGYLKREPTVAQKADTIECLKMQQTLVK